MKDKIEMYIPYSEEWKKEMLRLPKKAIIDMFADYANQLLSTEPEALGEEVKSILGMVNELNHEINLDERSKRIKAIQEFIVKSSHPKPVDEPKQLPNTTEGMSAEEWSKTFMLGDEFSTDQDWSMFFRYADEYNQSTSNNQQTELYIDNELGDMDADEQYSKCDPQPQKADSDKGAEEYCAIDALVELRKGDVENAIYILEKVITENGAEEYANQFASKPDKEWVSVEDGKPHCWESGEWDGKKSNQILCADDTGEKYLATCYEGFLDGEPFFDWYDKNDFEIQTKIVLWKEIT